MMKAVRAATRYHHHKNAAFQRGFRTDGRKDVGAAAVLDEVDDQWETAKPFTSIPGPKPLPIPYVGNLWRFMPRCSPVDMADDPVRVIPARFGLVGQGIGRPGRRKPLVSKWAEDMAVMQEDLHNQYGDIVRITGMGKEDMVTLYDPADVEKMFRNETHWPMRMSLRSLKYYRSVLRKNFYEGVEGLVTSQDEAWQSFRTATNQTMMQPRNIMRYLDPVASVVDELIDRIRVIRKPNQEMPDDFMCELNKFTLESIGVITLDTKFGCLRNDLSPDSEAMRMIENSKNILALMQKLEFGGFIWRFVSTPTWREFVRTMDEILEISIKYTNAKWEEIKKQGERGENENKSILESLLLKTKDPKIPIVMTTDAIFAGIDTTSNTTAVVLYYLATNPDKQEKLFQELRTLLPTKDAKITKEAFNELKYLRAAVKESMRLKPTAGVNQRTAKKDMVLGGYQIPAGTTLLSGHSVMCRKEKYFKNADKFVPERWLRSESQTFSEAIRPFVFLPFGFGQRSCIGKRIAEMEIELVVAKVIRNFDVSYHYGPMTYVSRLVTAPNKPLRFKMVERPE